MQTRPKTIAIAIDMPESSHRAGAKVCMFAFLLLIILYSSVAAAAEPLPTGGRHPLYHKALPPGAIWQSPAAVTMHQGAFQPVAFSGPEGTEFSLPLAGSHAESEPNLMAGLLVGAVYRFRITGISGAIGAELYPTVELIGRTYPPPGLETLYPIPINLSQSDLEEALDGNLVTRVIYLEDPQTAIPLAQQRTESRPIDIPLDQDALATADSLGRPIAIVRVGSKSPPRNPALEPQFYFGFPAWAPIYKPDPATQQP
ncbi:hypothetical protein Mal15_53770 [Stieleria maiorica]|uniref:Uncharacterized protein n=1 Tax=Stieleria maiorica TaxID=2795974 RepID=A0A5B9MMN6_9BACT|nr:hypothetical protein [Stieleria maiorica]QEG01301.1 hypothetical protein Mal15_53770 [Stieleria maiorica]